MRVTGLQAIIATVVSSIAVSCFSVSAGAGALKDVVADLYGGDGILLAPTPPPFPSHAPHFAASSLAGLDNLGTALTANVGQYSFNSTVTGFVFDIERGVPLRTIESLGPLLAERANTLGAKRFSFAASYSRIEFRRLEGTALDELSLTLSHPDVNDDGVLGPAGAPLDFELDEIRVDIDVELEQDVLALFGTYGLTEHWDVGIVVPIIHSRARAEGNATIIRNSAVSTAVHNFGPADAPRSVVDREATGVGDVILRTKYNLYLNEPTWPDLAVVGRVKLPTGDEDDLLGTGETDFLGLLVVSKSFDNFTPHLNLGYEVSTDSELSNLRYLAGFDYAFDPELTVAVDFLGRWEPAGDDIGDHVVDAALGFKWNPFGGLIFSANVQVPLNKDEGLRPDYIVTVGIERPF
jgi:hypothetical protein